MNLEGGVVVVKQNHDCRHHGEPVRIGCYTVYAGGSRLSLAALAETDVLVTLCDRAPLNLGSQELDHQRFPMEDFGGMPPDLRVFLEKVVIPAMMDAKRVTLHCEGGFGRTGTALAALIALLEPEINDPVGAVRERYCPRAVETLAQRQGITSLRSTVLAELPQNPKEGGTMSEQATGEWYMAGTEGTGEYLVLAMNDAGRLGIRPLADGKVRVRIEPIGEDDQKKLAKIFTVSKGWKQPDGQPRFSTVLSRGSEAINTVVEALATLKKHGGGELTRNAAERYWRRHAA